MGGCVSNHLDFPNEMHPNLFTVTVFNKASIRPIHGQLEVTDSQLIFYSKGHEPISWPFAYLRRYGYERETFCFESGRRCESGPGIFSFRCRRANELFAIVQCNIQESGVEERAAHHIDQQRNSCSLPRPTSSCGYTRPISLIDLNSTVQAGNDNAQAVEPTSNKTVRQHRSVSPSQFNQCVHQTPVCLPSTSNLDAQLRERNSEPTDQASVPYQTLVELPLSSRACNLRNVSPRSTSAAMYKNMANQRRFMRSTDSCCSASRLPSTSKAFAAAYDSSSTSSIATDVFLASLSDVRPVLPTTARCYVNVTPVTSPSSFRTAAHRQLEVQRQKPYSNVCNNVSKSSNVGELEYVVVCVDEKAACKAASKENRASHRKTRSSSLSSDVAQQQAFYTTIDYQRTKALHECQKPRRVQKLHMDTSQVSLNTPALCTSLS